MSPFSYARAMVTPALIGLMLSLERRLASFGVIAAPFFTATESLLTQMLPPSILVWMPASLNSLRTGPAGRLVFPGGKVDLVLVESEEELEGVVRGEDQSILAGQVREQLVGVLDAGLLKAEYGQGVLDHVDFGVAPQRLPDRHQLARPHFREIGHREDRVLLREPRDIL